MLEEANKLTRLVDSLLTIARADAGQIRLSPSKFPAEDLARESASLFEVLLEENGQSLVVETTGEAAVSGDWLLLRQALVNIVHNAIKFTPRGGLITLRIRAEEEVVVLEVEDTGPGIPPNELAKVFDRFYRVEEGRSREAGGAGLGLAIARWSVELHGGTLSAFSGTGRGCTFRITLPGAVREHSLA
jgi:signal transduction histidine kinase